METLAKGIYETTNRYYAEAAGHAKELATQCWICENTFMRTREKFWITAISEISFLAWVTQIETLQRVTAHNTKLRSIIAQSLSEKVLQTPDETQFG